MMTKYVLGSGGSRSSKDKGQAFFSEMLKGLGSNPKVLVCVFADTHERWESKFNKFSQQMLAVIPAGVKPVFSLARQENFEQQVKDNDLIYFYGGDVEVITFRLSKYNIPGIFESKVVAGSSAGSAVFATYCWGSDRRTPTKALGVLPIKFMPHYGASTVTESDTREQTNWEQGYKQLEAVGDTSQKIYTMSEGEFTTIQI